MRISEIQSGQRFGIEVHSHDNKPARATFTVVAVGLRPTHVTSAPFTHYRAAMVFLDNGKVAFLDPILMELCEPLVCLPRYAN